MGGHRPEGHITDPWNTRMEETSRRERRMKSPSEGGQGPEGTVVSQMDNWKIENFLIYYVKNAGSLPIIHKTK